MQNPLATVFLKGYLSEGPWESGMPEYTGDDLEFVIGTQVFREREDLVMQHVSFQGSVVRMQASSINSGFHLWV